MREKTLYFAGLGKVGSAIKNVIEQNLELYNLCISPIFLNRQKDLREFLQVVKGNQDGIVIDFSSTEGAKKNICGYLQSNIPFICGTTGINISSFYNSRYSKSFVYGPNMALPIVDLLMTFNSLNSKDLQGIELKIVESHQRGKKDISGTAIKVLEILKSKGVSIKFDENNVDYSSLYNRINGEITSVRNLNYQKEFIPEEHLGGHALHEYEIRGNLTRRARDLFDNWIKFNSEDSYNCEIKCHVLNNHFYISHKVLGRDIYAQGVLQAIDYLRSDNVKPGYNSMEDVVLNMRK